MTTSVAYRWAGAVTHVKPPFIVFLQRVTDGPTVQRTNWPTDRVTYRVACTRLKTLLTIGLDGAHADECKIPSVKPQRLRYKL